MKFEKNMEYRKGGKYMRKKIMVVDDNIDLLYMLKKGLERLDEGYEIIGVNSGKECLELLENNELPDLILLDIMMPEINGWDVFTEIKVKPNCREIPIIFLTAKKDDYSQGFGKLTADEYITKPFEIQELKERIDKILRR